jgi:predicted O-methyltransferase YrrM/tetratricopeptide (TPR) repeat protein
MIRKYSMVILNKKEYQGGDNFANVYHEEYFNLNIIPLAAVIEREAGLLSELAEMFSHNCTFELLGASQFLMDNLPQCSGTTVITYLNGDGEINGSFVLALESKSLDSMYKFKIYITNFEKVLYCNDSTQFTKHFKYYIEQGAFKFDNLICLCMIVKDAGPQFEKVLVDNLPSFDKWCILDTGSTDGTQDVIRRVLTDRKRGNLYEEPFINFKDSRNRCLELAGTSCKFLLTLDDTYVIQGDLKSFLTEVRGDQFSDSFSLLIKSDDSEYYSNRIIKSLSKLRYIHTIHEVITDKNNINVTVPKNRALILDNRSDYMNDRTTNRKQFDLKLLFKEVEDDPNDPRALYYIAQTYGCIGDEVNKAKYFELRINHPVQGYIQEKIDACFELARTYNFHLGKDWETCERLYQQAHDLDPERPDSTYFIGIHWYLEKNYEKAFYYFKKGFEIGYPLHKQYSLKPTLSFHFLPKFLTEVSYYMKDFITGEASARLFLQNNKLDCESWSLVSSWFSIHTNLNKMPSLASVPNRYPGKVLCIVADGGWSEWSGKDILTSGVGGSETWVIEMARNVPPDTRVIVFCKCKESEMFENVGYNPIDMFYNFISNNVVDYCIISRYTQYVPVALRGHALNVGIIFHDLLGMETVIPIHDKLKWMFCLTDWHSNYIKNKFPQLQSTVKTLNYGVSEKVRHGTKIKNSFIYSSFPNRGLIVLLKMWPRIHRKFPDAVLNIYCDVDGKWVNDVVPQEMKDIKILLKINKKGIVYHGWVSKDTLSKAWETAEYWLYPCKFEETFCLTALEAAASKTFAVTNNLAALSETVGDRGLIVHGNPLEQKWQDEVVSRLAEYMSGSLSSDELVDKNYKWSQTLTWKNQAKVLVDYLGDDKYIICNSDDPETILKNMPKRGYIENTWDGKHIIWTDRNTGVLMICSQPIKPEYTHIKTQHLFDESRPLEYKFVDTLHEAYENAILCNKVFNELITTGIDYCRMLNWTLDIPVGTRDDFLQVLQKLPEKSTILEIGTFAGTSIIQFLKNVVDSTGVVIDPWDDYIEHDNAIDNDTVVSKISQLNVEKIFYNNIKVSGLEDRIKVLKGSSFNKLSELTTTFDFIYIDGSHKCLDVYMDACLSWKLLKHGGIIAFDDYMFNKEDVLNSPHHAINYFMETIKGEFSILIQNYRLFLQKTFSISF